MSRPRVLRVQPARRLINELKGLEEMNSGAVVLRGCRPGFLKRHGFTLIEILVTVSIFVITTAALVGFYVSIAAMNESSRNMTRAMADARAVLEQIRNVSIGGLAAVTGTGWTAWATANNLTSLNNEAVTVAYVNPAADPLDVTVTINWSERGRARFAAVNTLVTQR
ncbi:MAG: type II secretion system protein [Candidatus Omnitrophica bacterium]|nr:type II secretion system protein [Candidatus Omnitrophota bacterium]